MSESVVQSLSGIPNWVNLGGAVEMGKVSQEQSISCPSTDMSYTQELTTVQNDLSEETIMSCGPWGGQGGTQFYDGRGDIVEIVLTYTDEHITCVQSSYNQAGTNFKTSAHGTPMKGQTSTIALSWPDEYLVQVKGTTDSCASIGVVVSSLTFITNKRVYGAYGKEKGQRFESLPGGKVVGFFGKSGTLLDQFGVLTQHSMTELQASQTLLGSADKVKNVFYYEQSDRASSGSVIVEGPWGGVGGKAFHDGNGRVVEIIVTFQQNQISSFQATYEHGGVHFQGSLHGIESGTRTKITFKPFEYLIQVKGTAGKIFGSEAITSLIFVTNQRIFGPYGCFTGRAFESSAGTREVSGFFGRCGSHLDQVGVITKVARHSDQNNTAVAVQGPWGGSHGSQFCSGTSDLEDIYVTFNKAHIVAFQVGYNLGSEVDSIKSDCWGGDIGETVKITLRPRGEIVIQLKGTTDVLHKGIHVVTSLTFITNKRVYGPYGQTVGSAFETALGRVVGFYGRSDSMLHQIGVITQPSSESHHVGGPRRSVKGNGVAYNIDGNDFAAKYSETKETNSNLSSSDTQNSSNKIVTNEKAKSDHLINHTGNESINSQYFGKGTSQSMKHSSERHEPSVLEHGSLDTEARKTSNNVSIEDFTASMLSDNINKTQDLSRMDDKFKVVERAREDVKGNHEVINKQTTLSILHDKSTGHVDSGHYHNVDAGDIHTDNLGHAHNIADTVDRGSCNGKFKKDSLSTLEHGSEDMGFIRTSSNIVAKESNSSMYTSEADRKHDMLRLKNELAKEEVEGGHEPMKGQAIVTIILDQGTSHVDKGHIHNVDSGFSSGKLTNASSTFGHGSHDTDFIKKISNIVTKESSISTQIDEVDMKRDLFQKENTSRVVDKVKEEVDSNKMVSSAQANVTIILDQDTSHVDKGHIHTSDTRLSYSKVNDASPYSEYGSEDSGFARTDNNMAIKESTTGMHTNEVDQRQDLIRRNEDIRSKVVDKVKREVEGCHRVSSEQANVTVIFHQGTSNYVDKGHIHTLDTGLSYGKDSLSNLGHGSNMVTKESTSNKRTDQANMKQDSFQREDISRVVEKMKEKADDSKRVSSAQANVTIILDQGTNHVDKGHIHTLDLGLSHGKVNNASSYSEHRSQDSGFTKTNNNMAIKEPTKGMHNGEVEQRQDSIRKEDTPRVVENVKKESVEDSGRVVSLFGQSNVTIILDQGMDHVNTSHIQTSDVGLFHNDEVIKDASSHFRHDIHDVSSFNRTYNNMLFEEPSNGAHIGEVDMRQDLSRWEETSKALNKVEDEVEGRHGVSTKQANATIILDQGVGHHNDVGYIHTSNGRFSSGKAQDVSSHSELGSKNMGFAKTNNNMSAEESIRSMRTNEADIRQGLFRREDTSTMANKVKEEVEGSHNMSNGQLSVRVIFNKGTSHVDTGPIFISNRGSSHGVARDVLSTFGHGSHDADFVRTSNNFVTKEFFSKTHTNEADMKQNLFQLEDTSRVVDKVKELVDNNKMVSNGQANVTIILDQGTSDVDKGHIHTPDTELSYGKVRDASSYSKNGGQDSRFARTNDNMVVNGSTTSMHTSDVNQRQDLMKREDTLKVVDPMKEELVEGSGHRVSNIGQGGLTIILDQGTSHIDKKNIHTLDAGSSYGKVRDAPSHIGHGIHNAGFTAKTNNNNMVVNEYDRSIQIDEANKKQDLIRKEDTSRVVDQVKKGIEDSNEVTSRQSTVRVIFDKGTSYVDTGPIRIFDKGSSYALVRDALSTFGHGSYDIGFSKTSSNAITKDSTAITRNGKDEKRQELFKGEDNSRVVNKVEDVESGHNVVRDASSSFEHGSHDTGFTKTNNNMVVGKLANISTRNDDANAMHNFLRMENASNVVDKVKEEIKGGQGVTSGQSMVRVIFNQGKDLVGTWPDQISNGGLSYNKVRNASSDFGHGSHDSSFTRTSNNMVAKEFITNTRFDKANSRQDSFRREDISRVVDKAKDEIDNSHGVTSRLAMVRDASPTFRHGTQDLGFTSRTNNNMAAKESTTNMHIDKANKMQDLSTRREDTSKVVEKVKKDDSDSQEVTSRHATVRVILSQGGTRQIDTGKINILDGELSYGGVKDGALTFKHGIYDTGFIRANSNVMVANDSIMGSYTNETKRRKNLFIRDDESSVIDKMKDVSSTLGYGSHDMGFTRTSSNMAIKDSTTTMHTGEADKRHDLLKREDMSRVVDKIKGEAKNSQGTTSEQSIVRVIIDQGIARVNTGHVFTSNEGLSYDEVKNASSNLEHDSNNNTGFIWTGNNMDIKDFDMKTRNGDVERRQNLFKRENMSRVEDKMNQKIEESNTVTTRPATVRVIYDQGMNHVDTGHICIANNGLSSGKVAYL